MRLSLIVNSNDEINKLNRDKTYKDYKKEF